MILELSAIVAILIHPRTIRWAYIGALLNIPSGAEISTVGIDGLSQPLSAIGFLIKRRVESCMILGQGIRSGTGLSFKILKIRIGIPCFNERNIIEKIMDACCASSIRHKYLFAVDDCSTDGTREILATQLTSRIGQFIYHRMVEAGISYDRRT